MKVAKNWADRKHSPPGPKDVVTQHKGMASGIEVRKPERETVPPGMRGSETGRVYTPGWFSTRK